MAILGGVDTPMILRRAGDSRGRYIAIGPAYVLGLMDLEGFEPSTVGREWEDITLI